MTKDQLRQFAKALGLSKVSTTKRAGWIIAACPMRWLHDTDVAHGQTFGLKIGKTFCTCFSCGWHGDPEDLLMQLAARFKGNKVAAARILAARTFLDANKPALTIGKDEDEEEVDEIIEWPEWWQAGIPKAYDHPYLLTRKGGPIPHHVAARMDFRLDVHKHRLGVPIRDFTGRLMGFHARTVENHPLPYLAYKFQGHWNKPIWLGEDKVDLSKPVLVVESVFDMARALQVYDNVVSPLMASLPKSKIDRLREALNIVLLFDSDKAGAQAATKLKAGLPDTTFIEPGLPGSYKDPGECPALELYFRLKGCLDVHEPADC